MGEAAKLFDCASFFGGILFGACCAGLARTSSPAVSSDPKGWGLSGVGNGGSCFDCVVLTLRSSAFDIRVLELVKLHRRCPPWMGLQSFPDLAEVN